MKKFSGDMGPVLFEPWGSLYRWCEGRPRLQRVVMWLGRRLQPRSIEMDASRFAEDPFASVWDAVTLERARDLLRRIGEVAEAQGVPLYLFWGTLLGHVRQGGILPWDDDADLALFDPERVSALKSGFEAAGLVVLRFNGRTDEVIKIFDRNHPQIPGREWSFPFVDIFCFDFAEGSGNGLPLPPFDREMLLPGRPVAFEGSRLWEIERPLAMLDAHYRGWRSREKSTWWNHREERMMRIIAVRTIRTDENGRKLT